MPYLTSPCPVPEPMDCRILTAALDLFVEKGFHNVSVHEVRERADVSIGSVYKHFGGKEGIAKALYVHILGELDLLVDQVLAAHKRPIDQCAAIVAALFGHTETHRNIIAYLFHTKHAEFLPDEPHTCTAAPFAKMRRMVEQAMAAGEFVETEPVVAAAAIFGAMEHMIRLRLDGEIKKPLPEYAAPFLETVWNGLAADAPGAPAAPENPRAKRVDA